jgi:hypothetical protein
MYAIGEISDLIEAGGLGTSGVDIFEYSAPAEVQSCIIVYPSNDPPIIDPQTPFYFKGKFQTIVRNASMENGIAICKELATILTLNNIETPTITIKQCRPLFQPRVYRRSEAGILEFSVTYQIHYVEK